MANKRPGGRSARVRAAVLEATLEELANEGYTGLSFAAVARRAGVNKTTLYRRWGTRERLTLDALLELGRRRVPIPDTGSLRGDLFEYGAAIAASARTPEVEAIIRAIASIGDADEALREASHRFWSARLELASQMVERAIARGEVPPETDAALVAESVIGPIYFRLLLSGGELDEAQLERLADFAAGAAGQP
jgi:AcrR family transcriptional regulator